jgi:hypothetical protein
VLESPKPGVSKSFPVFASLNPNSLEVTLVAHVFSYCNSGVQVYDCMPPPSRNKNGFPRVLDAFDNFEFSVFGLLLPLILFKSWPNEVIKVNSLIVLSFLHYVLSSSVLLSKSVSGWKQNPSLESLDRCVPG